MNYVYLLMIVYVLIKRFSKKDYSLDYVIYTGLGIVIYLYPQYISFTYFSPDMGLYNDMSMGYLVAIYLLMHLISPYPNIIGIDRPAASVKYNKWSRLYLSMIFFSGLMFTYLTASVTEEMSSLGTQWSGVGTIYVFFASLIRLSAYASIYFLIYYRTSKLLNVIFMLTLIVLIGEFLLNARRSAGVEIFFLFMFYITHVRKIVFSKLLFLVGCFSSYLVLNFISYYRTYLKWGEGGLTSTGIVEFLYLPFRSLPLDWINVVYAFSSLSTYSLDFMASLWNGLVHSFIPGQLVGFSVKEGLKLEVQNAFDSSNSPFYVTGSFDTGLVQSFAGLGYFAFLVYLIIFFLLRRQYFNRHLSVYNFSLYLYIFPSIPLLIISSISDFVSKFIFASIFLIPFLFSRVKI